MICSWPCTRRSSPPRSCRACVPNVRLWSDPIDRVKAYVEGIYELTVESRARVAGADDL